MKKIIAAMILVSSVSSFSLFAETQEEKTVEELFMSSLTAEEEEAKVSSVAVEEEEAKFSSITAEEEESKFVFEDSSDEEEVSSEVLASFNNEGCGCGKGKEPTKEKLA